MTIAPNPTVLAAAPAAETAVADVTSLLPASLRCPLT
jgi:hypothetical protein